eukprot:GHVU01116514.1.p1 GENE.GHVU01116514.1~~GHVU01116514.1.p1  ORF type:complete len:167 (+),score=26.06 GHVU01116514.1:66-503(+)
MAKKTRVVSLSRPTGMVMEPNPEGFGGGSRVAFVVDDSSAATRGVRVGDVVCTARNRVIYRSPFEDCLRSMSLDVYSTRKRLEIGVYPAGTDTDLYGVPAFTWLTSSNRVEELQEQMKREAGPPLKQDGGATVTADAAAAACVDR